MRRRQAIVSDRKRQFFRKLRSTYLRNLQSEGDSYYMVIYSLLLLLAFCLLENKWVTLTDPEFCAELPGCLYCLCAFRDIYMKTNENSCIIICDTMFSRNSVFWRYKLLAHIPLGFWKRRVKRQWVHQSCRDTCWAWCSACCEYPRLPSRLISAEKCQM